MVLVQVMGQQRFLQPGGMQVEHAGIEYEVMAYEGMACKGEDQHNPTRELLFRIMGSEDKIHRMNNLFHVVKGLIGTL